MGSSPAIRVVSGVLGVALAAGPGRAEAADPEVDAPAYRPWVVSGSVSLGVAAVGLGVMGAGLLRGARAEEAYVQGPTRADRDAAQADGQAGNVMAAVGAGAAAVFVAVGAGLLTKGLRMRVAVVPSAERGGGGLVWIVRF